MIVTKCGRFKLKELYKVQMYKCKCNECDAEFEAQSGEIPNDRTFACPYCNTYHSNYQIEFSREELMPYSSVIGFNSNNTKVVLTE